MTAALEGEWVVSSTPRPHFTPRKDPVPILQNAGWVPGPVWTGGKSRAHRNSIPDLPARSSVAIRTELPGPLKYLYITCKYIEVICYRYLRPKAARFERDPQNYWDFTRNRLYQKGWETITEHIIIFSTWNRINWGGRDTNTGQGTIGMGVKNNWCS